MTHYTSIAQWDGRSTTGDPFLLEVTLRGKWGIRRTGDAPQLDGKGVNK
jgi:hypothetical protein